MTMHHKEMIKPDEASSRRILVQDPSSHLAGRVHLHILMVVLSLLNDSSCHLKTQTAGQGTFNSLVGLTSIIHL
jgi:hypothetical protein